MTAINIESTIWLDNLPTEILFEIFDYLSSNDIIYAFFFLNQRFNNLLLENSRRYLTYLEFPTTNLNLWENILSKIGSEIQCLNLNTYNLSFSLKYFSNLKSITVCSYALFDEELLTFIESEEFQNLKSFKVKEKKIFSYQLFHNNFFDQSDLFKKIFNSGNSLQILTLPLIYIIHIENLKINSNLHSMTLHLNSFENIFFLINLTPNLEYLNVDSYQPDDNQNHISINQTNIKLKQFYLTLREGRNVLNNFNLLTNRIKEFSSKLICLSLNVMCLLTKDRNDFPFNSKKLQEFLESMIELKQFHLYARLFTYSIDQDEILSSFRNKFWFDRNWSFGMHRSHFYTLPFHFDHLYGFHEDFNNVKSTNPEFLINNSRIWSNVKSIQLFRTLKYDENFISELKIKMPKLNTIKFSCDLLIVKHNSCRERIDVRLENVTTVEITYDHLENRKDWIINALPNLKHLILYSTELPSIDSQLAPIFNERIEKLDINLLSGLRQLTEISYIYFSNVQYINFCVNGLLEDPKWFVNYTMKILKNFRNLKCLLIYIYPRLHIYNNIDSERDFRQLVKHLDMNLIMKKYDVKDCQEYFLFLKTQFNDNEEIQDVTPITQRKSTFFTGLLDLIFRKNRS